MNIAQHVERGRRIDPDRPALAFEGRAWSYAELDREASRAASAFAALGAGAGDRIALVLPNTPAWAVCYLGAQKLGAVTVSINPNLKPHEIRFILEDSGARIAVASADARRALAGEPVESIETWLVADSGSASSLDDLMRGASPDFAAIDLAPEAPSAIVYTSGTTGFPKGAVLSHANVVSNVEAKRRYLGIRPEDRLLLFLPLFHCFGQNAIFNAALQSGATVLLGRRFDADEVLETIRRERATMFFGVPATFILLHDRAERRDLEGLRYVFSAAAPLPVEIEKAWEAKFGLPIYQGYGLTETSPFASYNHESRRKPGSVGTPIDGVEMRVVDVETGEELPPGAPGEIVVRGPNVMLGYWRRPEETAEAMRGGWFHTGDVGRMDDEGYFFVEDRVKDMVNVGGMKVYPAEVENVLYGHPKVAEAAVYGVPDPVMGERVCADIVARSGVHEAAIVAFCRERLADYKVPHMIHVVDEIPKSPTGKVLKRVLRERRAAEGVAPRADGGDAREPALEWIVRWLASELGVERDAIEAHKSLFEYGVTSADAVRLARQLGEWLGRPLQPTIAWSYPTVEALAASLDAGASSEAHAATRAAAAPELPSNFESVSDADLADLLRAEIAASRGEEPV